MQAPTVHLEALATQVATMRPHLDELVRPTHFPLMTFCRLPSVLFSQCATYQPAKSCHAKPFIAPPPSPSQDPAQSGLDHFYLFWPSRYL